HGRRYFRGAAHRSPCRRDCGAFPDRRNTRLEFSIGAKRPGVSPPPGRIPEEFSGRYPAPRITSRPRDRSGIGGSAAFELRTSAPGGNTLERLCQLTTPSKLVLDQSSVLTGCS